MTLRKLFKKKSVGFKIALLASLMFISFMLHMLIAMYIVNFLFDFNSNLIFSITNKQSVSGLKIIQFFNGIGLFIIPLLIYRHLTGFNFKLNFDAVNRQNILLLISIIVLVNPVVSFLYEWNQNINIPDWLLNYEIRANELTEAFLQMNSLSDLLINLFILALVPAIGEELFFRGYIQQSLSKWINNSSAAIFITAILFSAVHMQFQGFLPRLFLGIMLGYFLYWSKSLWLPIIAHFINNALAVVFSYPKFSQHSNILTNSANLKEAIFSFIAISLLLFLLYNNLKMKKES